MDERDDTDDACRYETHSSPFLFDLHTVGHHKLYKKYEYNVSELEDTDRPALGEVSGLPQLAYLALMDRCLGVS